MTNDFLGQRIDLAKETDFRLGGLIVRPSAREIEIDGKIETLQPRIMQVLVALVRRSGQVVSRDELTELCWEGRVVGDDALNRCVQQLRKLGETSHAFRLETVPKVGYRLHAEGTATLVASLPETTSPTPATVDASRTAIPTRPRWVIPVAAMALFVLAAVTIFGVRGTGPTAGRIAYFGIDASVEDKEATAVAAATSIDILNSFIALQRDVAASTATDGVPASERVDRALKLNAQYIVSGMTSRQGDVMSVSIRVEDAHSRTALWSETFEGSAFKPTAIASRVAALLNDRMGCVINMRASLQTDDMRIVSLLPKACESIRSTSAGSAERWSKLVKLAPTSAWVLSGEATALLSSIANAPPTNVDSLKRRADESLRRAEQIDPTDPALRIALVRAAEHRGATLLEIEQLLLKGLELAAPDGNLNGNYAGFLSRAGRTKDGLRFIRRALVLDPLSAPKMLGAAETLVNVEALAEAEQWYVQRHARFPDDAEWQSHITAALFHGVGDIDAILHDPPPSASRQSIACVEDIVGLVRVASQASLREAARTAADCGNKGALQLARADYLRALLRDFDFMFALEAGDSKSTYSASFSRNGNLYRALYDPKLSQLRSDPRFVSLMEKHGFVAYWRDSKHMPDFCSVEQAPVCALLVGK